MVEIDEEFLQAYESAINEHERHGQLIKQGAPLTRESGESLRRLESFQGYDAQRSLIAEIRVLRELVFPKTEFRPDDDGGMTTCKECGFSAEEDDGDPHTYRDGCIPAIQSANDYVYGMLKEDHDRITAINQRLLDGFARWKRKDLDTEEFEGLFYELLVQVDGTPAPSAQTKAP